MLALTDGGHGRVQVGQVETKGMKSGAGSSTELHPPVDRDYVASRDISERYSRA